MEIEIILRGQVRDPKLFYQEGIPPYYPPTLTEMGTEEPIGVPFEYRPDCWWRLCDEYRWEATIETDSPYISIWVEGYPPDVWATAKWRIDSPCESSVDCESADPWMEVPGYGTRVTVDMRAVASPDGKVATVWVESVEMHGCTRLGFRCCGCEETVFWGKSVGQVQNLL